jgi:hypothetical protein
MPTSIERHAVYATAKLNVKDPRARGGVRVESVCFRVGQPVDLSTAMDRHERLAGTGATFKHGRVRHARRWYRIDFYEVRSTDRHGRGLGSERHATALPVPYRAHRA